MINSNILLLEDKRTHEKKRQTQGFEEQIELFDSYCSHASGQLKVEFGYVRWECFKCGHFEHLERLAFTQ